MATLNHITKEIPKELFIVREGKRNRVFWSYSRANVYFNKLNIEDNTDENISLIAYVKRR